MKIRYDNTFIEIIPSDSSVRVRSIMGEHTLTLHYSLPMHVELPLGAYVDYEGLRYSLAKSENFKRNGKRNYEYTVILETSQVSLSKYIVRNAVDDRMKFSLTATPKEHLRQIVQNLNRRENGWSIGSCIEAAEKPIEYNFTYCDDALQQLASAYETEWEVVGKVINLCKVEYHKDSPVPLGCGNGKGFLPGVSRSTSSDNKQLEILHIQGGEKNIDFSKYNNRTLLLPKNQTYTYNGRTYQVSADGMSIFRADKVFRTNTELPLDLTHIYPKRVGDVTSFAVTEKGFCDIIDNTIPENLNYEGCLIAGEKMTIIFQTGMLAGKEFDVKYIHSSRKFEIVEQEIDGVKMPKGMFMPKVGDKYAVFNVMLPDAYLCDNATQTGASWDAFKEACRYFYENEDAKFNYAGELDGMFTKDKWLEIGGKLRPGGYVILSDDDFLTEPALVRITTVRDYPTRPCKPKIDLSNGVIGSSVYTDLGKLENADAKVDKVYEDSIKYTKRRWRDAMEGIEMVEKLVGELAGEFSGGIMPITVRTMALLLGDESLQYKAPTLDVTYDSITKVLNIRGSIIAHQTLNKPKVLKAGVTAGGKAWISGNYTSPPLTDGDKSYYIYIRASKTSTAAVPYLHEEPQKFDTTEGYNLLVGMLSSELDGERSYGKLFGYTEILPGRITSDTMVIQSDKTTFADGDGNEIAVFDGTGGGLVRMKNISINGFFKQSFKTQLYGSDKTFINLDLSYNIIFKPESNTIIAPILMLPYDDKYNGVVFKFVVLQGDRTTNSLYLFTTQINGEFNSQKLHYTQPIFTDNTSNVAGLVNAIGFSGSSGPIYMELLQVTKDIIMVLNASYALNQVEGMKSN